VLDHALEYGLVEIKNGGTWTDQPYVNWSKGVLIGGRVLPIDTLSWEWDWNRGRR